jgi:hypothetical protein
MPKVTVQARMPGEKKWKTRNTFFQDNEQTETIVAQANKTMQTWRNYQDGAELRVHVQ